LLAEFFLRKYSDKYSKPGIRLNSGDIEELLSYSWPGNVRDTLHRSLNLLNKKLKDTRMEIL